MFTFILHLLRRSPIVVDLFLRVVGVGDLDALDLEHNADSLRVQRHSTPYDSCSCSRLIMSAMDTGMLTCTCTCMRMYMYMYAYVHVHVHVVPVHIIPMSIPMSLPIHVHVVYSTLSLPFSRTARASRSRCARRARAATAARHTGLCLRQCLRWQSASQ